MLGHILGGRAGRRAGDPWRRREGPRPGGRRKQAAHEAKRKAAHEALTLDALLDQWETLRLADKRERYAAEAVRAVRYAFAKHLTRRPPTSTAPPCSRARPPRQGWKAGDGEPHGRLWARRYHWAVKRGSLESQPVYRTFRLPPSRSASAF